MSSKVSHRNGWKIRINIGPKEAKSNVNIIKVLELRESFHYFCSQPQALPLYAMPLNLGSNVKDGVRTRIVEYCL